MQVNSYNFCTPYALLFAKLDKLKSNAIIELPTNREKFVRIAQCIRLYWASLNFVKCRELMEVPYATHSCIDEGEIRRE